MHDTSPEIEEMVREMFRKKTPEERLKMGISMYQTSKYLITRGILEAHPTISNEGLRREIFLKFYGNDFDPITREKIIQYLETHPVTKSLDDSTTVIVKSN